jgi:hypothetical protein
MEKRAVTPLVEEGPRPELAPPNFFEISDSKTRLIKLRRHLVHIATALTSTFRERTCNDSKNVDDNLGALETAKAAQANRIKELIEHKAERERMMMGHRASSGRVTFPSAEVHVRRTSNLAQ